MPNPSYKPNPFEQDETLTPIFEASSRYQNTKNQALNAFKTQNVVIQSKAKNPFQIIINSISYFNLIKFMSYNFTHFTKFSIAGLALFTVLAGGLSAQAFAPENIKPTQLIQSVTDKYFGANKQLDSNPRTPLEPDANNDVASLDYCDLSIKYPKEISTDFVVEASESENRSVYNFHSSDGNSFMMIKCVNKSAGDDYYNEIDAIPSEVRSQTLVDKITQAQLAEFPGWFLSESNDIEVKKIKSPYLEGYYFINTKTNMKYSITIFDKSYLNYNDFQLQFNSGVVNKQNSKLNSISNECIVDAKLNNSTVVGFRDSAQNDLVSSTYLNDVEINGNFYSRISISCSANKNDLRQYISDISKGKIGKIDNLNMLNINFVNNIKPESILIYDTAKSNVKHIEFESNNGNFYFLSLVK